MKFTIQSFLLKPDISKKTKKICLPTSFVNIKNADYITQNKKNFDVRNLEGYISCIDESSRILLDSQEWDSISDLWSYLLNAMEETIISGSSDFYFPSQPLKFTFKLDKNKKLIIQVGESKKWLLPQLTFFKALLDAAHDYFSTIGAIFSTGIFVKQISQINRINYSLKN